jgi:hypothetical protein
MTYGEEFDLALACNTQEEADEFVRTNIAHRVKDFGQTPEEAEKVLKANLGYMAGYYDQATAKKIEKLFNAPHPIFGSTRPTAEEAFAKGLEIAKSSSK